jgi:hypothetical protein
MVTFIDMKEPRGQTPWLFTVVMTKGPGKMEAQKDWRIEEIKVED